MERGPRLNRAIREQHCARSLPAIQADFEGGYERILEIVEVLSSSQLLNSGHYEWTRSHPLITYIGPNTASHYRFALRVIKRWLKGTARANAS
jgi:hypothetical protein